MKNSLLKKKMQITHFLMASKSIVSETQIAKGFHGVSCDPIPVIFLFVHVTVTFEKNIFVK